MRYKVSVCSYIQRSCVETLSMRGNSEELDRMKQYYYDLWSEPIHPVYGRKPIIDICGFDCPSITVEGENGEIVFDREVDNWKLPIRNEITKPVLDENGGATCVVYSFTHQRWFKSELVLNEPFDASKLSFCCVRIPCFEGHEIESRLITEIKYGDCGFHLIDPFDPVFCDNGSQRIWASQGANWIELSFELFVGPHRPLLRPLDIPAELLRSGELRAIRTISHQIFKLDSFRALAEDLKRRTDAFRSAIDLHRMNENQVQRLVEFSDEEKRQYCWLYQFGSGYICSTAYLNGESAQGETMGEILTGLRGMDYQVDQQGQLVKLRNRFDAYQGYFENYGDFGFDMYARNEHSDSILSKVKSVLTPSREFLFNRLQFLALEGVRNVAVYDMKKLVRLYNKMRADYICPKSQAGSARKCWYLMSSSIYNILQKLCPDRSRQEIAALGYYLSENGSGCIHSPTRKHRHGPGANRCIGAP